MRRNRTVLLAVVIIVVVAGVAVSVISQRIASAQPLILYGNIEGTESQVATEIGGRVKNVYVQEGDEVHAGQPLADIFQASSNANEKLVAPFDGIVAERLVEPDELTRISQPVVVIASLDDLTLKVYAPEDRYGEVLLGRHYPVTVDDYPNQVFTGTVAYVAKKAEYTPRNVQTTDGRKTTVFTVKIELSSAGGTLRPGMPAQVRFEPQN